jgi:hypothetical protein
MGGLNKKLVETGLASYTSEDVMATRSEYNSAQRLLGSLWEKLSHEESPLEYLTPMRPKAKFLHQRSAIEEYERTRVWGTEAAFWQHPVQQFLKPALQTAKHDWLGSKEIPESVQKRREIEEYFDKLKWLKYEMLEEMAKNARDTKSAKEFRAQQQRTLFGVNPYGMPGNIYSSMPTLDRDYYENFVKAQTPEDRRTIMEIVAPNQRKLYMAQWMSQLVDNVRADAQMGKKTSIQAEREVRALNNARMAEGQPINQELFAQYKQEAEQGESYATWSRRKEIAEYFQKAPLPPANYVGWHPSVDLEDVKLKIVDNMGMDIHDYNLWESRRRELLRKPYISSENPLQEPGIHYDNQMMTAITKTMQDVLKLKNVQVHVLPAPAGQDIIDIQIQDNRKDAIQRYKQDENYAEMR